MFDGCFERCNWCLTQDDPSDCIFCQPEYYRYDTASLPDDKTQTYYICLTDCGSGIEKTEDPKMCFRNENSNRMFAWDKFDTYLTEDAVNQYMEDIDVWLIGA